MNTFYTLLLLISCPTYLGAQEVNDKSKFVLDIASEPKEEQEQAEIISNETEQMNYSLERNTSESHFNLGYHETDPNLEDLSFKPYDGIPK